MRKLSLILILTISVTSINSVAGQRPQGLLALPLLLGRMILPSGKDVDALAKQTPRKRRRKSGSSKKFSGRKSASSASTGGGGAGSGAGGGAGGGSGGAGDRDDSGREGGDESGPSSAEELKALHTRIQGLIQLLRDGWTRRFAAAVAGVEDEGLANAMQAFNERMQITLTYLETELLAARLQPGPVMLRVHLLTVFLARADIFSFEEAVYRELVTDGGDAVESIRERANAMYEQWEAGRAVDARLNDLRYFGRLYAGRALLEARRRVAARGAAAPPVVAAPVLTGTIAAPDFLALDLEVVTDGVGPLPPSPEEMNPSLAAILMVAESGEMSDSDSDDGREKPAKRGKK